ncbi:MAG: hypothetical protein WA771_10525 [Chthoniobacterales bacterium]
MNPDQLNEENYCRLARAVLERFGGSYPEAMETLGTFRLNLICGEEIRHSAALQAALLTAVNTGKRAFLGGVFVEMPPMVAATVPWPGEGSLNDIVRSLGARLCDPQHSDLSHTLHFGGAVNPVPDALSVICSGWRGGVAPAEMSFSLHDDIDFAMGGIAAGAMGVARGFLRVCGLSSHFVQRPLGVSLWRPDLEWTDEQARGPELEYLPANLWLLGLGHLGQAYLWNAAMLPYEKPCEALFMLQDFDRVVEGNLSAGLLCEKSSAGRLKTRLCSEWLEERGFRTRICERRFDSTVRCEADEPLLALCGFDSAPARRCLEDAGFKVIVECGLGGSVDTFDQLSLHTFPESTRTPAQIWAEEETVEDMAQPALLDAFRTEDPCGIVAETLAGKALSSSFVGAYAGALVMGEVLRGLHGGIRCEVINGQLRSNSPLRVAARDKHFQHRLALAGFTVAKPYFC